MIISIIGTGHVGSALAHRFFKAKHTVLMGAQFPLSERSLVLARQLGEDRFTTPQSAAKQAEAILIATPAHTMPNVARSLGNTAGKVIIDATNSVRSAPEGYANGFEALRALCPQAELVKCFNTTGAANMANPIYPGGPIDLFMAGSSTRAKAIARQLALDAGFGECFDFGGDAQVPLLENFALAWINLAMQGFGENFALRLVKR